MLNNNVLTSKTMPNMHETMSRLYKFAKENAGICGLTPVADKLGAAVQVVKNWESRGVSLAGALDAQRVFGCDANWLLGNDVGVFQQQTTGVLAVNEPTAGWQWPFWSVSPKEYALLTKEERDHIEHGIALSVKNRGSPANQERPEYKITAK